MMASLYEILWGRVEFVWGGHYWDFFIIGMMGTVIAMNCGLLGLVVSFRRGVLMGDAISHSLLPGVVMGYLLSGVKSEGVIMVGGVVAGLMAVCLVRWLKLHGRVREDAAIGIVFTVFFAIGVVLINIFARQVDLDVECVLFGDLSFIHFEPGWECGVVRVPYVLLKQVGVLVGIGVIGVSNWKWILVGSFDPEYSRSIGVSMRLFDGILYTVLALVLVLSFKAVGGVLVIGMMSLPVVTARIFSRRLIGVVGWIVILSGIYGVGCIYIGTIINASLSGTLVGFAFTVFLIVFIINNCFVKRR